MADKDIGLILKDAKVEDYPCYRYIMRRINDIPSLLELCKNYLKVNRPRFNSDEEAVNHLLFLQKTLAVPGSSIHTYDLLQVDEGPVSADKFYSYIVTNNDIAKSNNCYEFYSKFSKKKGCNFDSTNSVCKNCIRSNRYCNMLKDYEYSLLKYGLSSIDGARLLYNLRLLSDKEAPLDCSISIPKDIASLLSSLDTSFSFNTTVNVFEQNIAESPLVTCIVEYIYTALCDCVRDNMLSSGDICEVVKREFYTNIYNKKEFVRYAGRYTSVLNAVFEVVFNDVMGAGELTIPELFNNMPTLINYTKELSSATDKGKNVKSLFVKSSDSKVSKANKSKKKPAASNTSSSSISGIEYLDSSLEEIFAEELSSSKSKASEELTVSADLEDILYPTANPLSDNALSDDSGSNDSNNDNTAALKDSIGIDNVGDLDSSITVTGTGIDPDMSNKANNIDEEVDIPHKTHRLKDGTVILSEDEPVDINELDIPDMDVPDMSVSSDGSSDDSSDTYSDEYSDEDIDMAADYSSIPDDELPFGDADVLSEDSIAEEYYEDTDSSESSGFDDTDASDDEDLYEDEEAGDIGDKDTEDEDTEDEAKTSFCKKDNVYSDNSFAGAFEPNFRKYLIYENTNPFNTRPQYVISIKDTDLSNCLDISKDIGKMCLLENAALDDNHVCLEAITKENDRDILLLYTFYEGDSYYMYIDPLSMHINVKEMLSELLSRQSIVKVTYSAMALYAFCKKYNLKVRNIHSISTIHFQIHSLVQNVKAAVYAYNKELAVGKVTTKTELSTITEQARYISVFEDKGCTELDRVFVSAHQIYESEPELWNTYIGRSKYPFPEDIGLLSQLKDTGISGLNHSYNYLELMLYYDDLVTTPYTHTVYSGVGDKAGVKGYEYGIDYDEDDIRDSVLAGITCYSSIYDYQMHLLKRKPLLDDNGVKYFNKIFDCKFSETTLNSYLSHTCSLGHSVDEVYAMGLISNLFVYDCFFMATPTKPYFKYTPEELNKKVDDDAIRGCRIATYHLNSNNGSSLKYATLSTLVSLSRRFKLDKVPCGIGYMDDTTLSLIIERDNFDIISSFILNAFNEDYSLIVSADFH